MRICLSFTDKFRFLWFLLHNISVFVLFFILVKGFFLDITTTIDGHEISRFYRVPVCAQLRHTLPGTLLCRIMIQLFFTLQKFVAQRADPFRLASIVEKTLRISLICDTPMFRRQEEGARWRQSGRTSVVAKSRLSRDSVPGRWQAPYCLNSVSIALTRLPTCQW